MQHVIYIFAFWISNELKTFGITLLFQFQLVYIFLGITLLISYYCHFNFIPNYKVKNYINNINKRQYIKFMTYTLISLYKIDVHTLQKFIGYTCHIYLYSGKKMDVHALQNFVDILAF